MSRKNTFLFVTPKKMYDYLKSHQREAHNNKGNLIPNCLMFIAHRTTLQKIFPILLMFQRS